MKWTVSLDFGIVYQIHYKFDFGTACSLYNSTATDLVKNFNEELTGVDPSKNLQISMDGPNVNLKFLENIRKEREEAKLSKFIDIGSCDLHVLMDLSNQRLKKLIGTSKVSLRAAFNF